MSLGGVGAVAAVAAVVVAVGKGGNSARDILESMIGFLKGSQKALF